MRLDRPSAGPLLVVALALAPGCAAIFGLDEKRVGSDAADASNADAANGQDASAEDGASDEAAVSTSACPFDADGFGDLQASSCWDTVDFADVAPGAAVGSTQGIAFDGRYMFFVPRPGAVVLRYDTTAPLGARGSWAQFDVRAELGFAPGFSGAVFDGRFVTLVPRSSSPLVVRYDTTRTFGDKASWDSFDPTSLDAAAVGFAGGVFDGKFVYFVPQEHAIVLRHDASAAAQSGWQKFDLAPLQLGTLSAFWGGVFDGRGITLAPEGDGVAVRFDTTGSFTSASSWSKFDAGALRNGETYQAGAFDGRYVFMGPGAAEGIVCRYDSQAGFTDGAAWKLFDMNALSPKLGLFQGAAFDGRFAYFTPVGTTNGAKNRLLVRYDTTKPFEAGPSWSMTDTSLANAGPFSSSAFDGQYVYFAPSADTTLARFRTRSTPKQVALPAFHGSFF